MKVLQTSLPFSNVGSSLAPYQALVNKINAIEPELTSLSDDELRSSVQELRNSILQQGTITDHTISKSFALVREASARVLGLRHYDVQLLGGLVLHDGKIAEMKTGEGKTIVALLPSFLNALVGKGAHVITVNDYLARRDAEFVGRVHQYLGLSVGLLQENITQVERKKNYGCDIVYLTNKDLGYDYLRDNLVLTSEEVVQSPLHYCVVDEIDSILIDAAQIPILISEPVRDATHKYSYCARIAGALKRSIHYLVDEKKRTVSLLREGLTVCKQVLKISNLYKAEDPWIPFLLNAIKAKELVSRNTHYVISEDGEIVLVDEFTGRALKGVRWGDGLHRAVEAKEKMVVQSTSKTIACITYQNLFLLYEKLSGMTGTAISEAAEFERIYNLQSLAIPTYKPVRRKDFLDVVYSKQYLKWQAIAKACFDLYNLGRPVLVGTTTIEKSELLAGLLTEYSVPYRLLNAKPENVENEADIIAQAGCFQSVTISTNMAGRGTDIILGGNAERLVKIQLTEYSKSLFEPSNSLTGGFTKSVGGESSIKDFVDVLHSFDQEWFDNRNNLALVLGVIQGESRSTSSKVQLLQVARDRVIADQERVQKEVKAKVLNVGGLYVIGTERHESRRVDNQLRGRAGRQGDPGSSRFFLSVDDRLLRLFGGNQIVDLLSSLGFDSSTPFQSPIITQRLNSIQEKVEAYYFDARKYLFEYDLVLSLQRTKFYSERKKVLEERDANRWVTEYSRRLVYDFFSFSTQLDNPVLAGLFLSNNLQKCLGSSYWVNLSTPNLKSREMLVSLVDCSYRLLYTPLDLRLVSTDFSQAQVLPFVLQSLDDSWQDHLSALTSLRDSIGWCSYGQRNPLLEYKKESYNLFVKMLINFRFVLITSCLGINMFTSDDSWVKFADVRNN